jgi:hypothetical protein
MPDEKKSAGVSYIVDFYFNVQYLTEQYSNYLNLMLQLESQYGDAEKQEGMEENEKQLLGQWVQEVRRLVHKTYIGYATISKQLKIDTDKNIREIYGKIKKTYIISRDELEDYVMHMHSVLVKDIIQELLTSNQDLIDGIYRTTGAGNST